MEPYHRPPIFLLWRGLEHLPNFLSNWTTVSPSLSLLAVFYRICVCRNQSRAGHLVTCSCHGSWQNLTKSCTSVLSKEGQGKRTQSCGSPHTQPLWITQGVSKENISRKENVVNKRKIIKKKQTISKSWESTCTQTHKHIYVHTHEHMGMHMFAHSFEHAHVVYAYI